MNGSLLLVGGKDGRNSDRRLLERFVHRCGGSNARIMVITAASAEPERHREEYSRAFHALGVEEVSVFHLIGSESPDPSPLPALNDADGVYFSGGGQQQLVEAIANSGCEVPLYERFCEGLHVGGTSAGASAMSNVMIAGSRQDSVELAKGIGLLPGVIVDQHFRQRDRLGRLWAATMLHPSLLGLGIDEATAVEVDPSGCATVFGAGSVTVIDGADASATARAKDDKRCFVGVRLHALVEGCSFDLASRRISTRSLAPRLDGAPVNGTPWSWCDRLARNVTDLT